MSVRVIPTLLARLDLDRIFAYFVEKKAPDVAARFNEAFEGALAFIAEFPELGIPHDSEKSGLRAYASSQSKGLKNISLSIAWQQTVCT